LDWVFNDLAVEETFGDVLERLCFLGEITSVQLKLKMLSSGDF
jgi:hypothetical protein